jgi:hypothetical protein
MTSVFAFYATVIVVSMVIGGTPPLSGQRNLHRLLFGLAVVTNGYI